MRLKKQDIPPGRDGLWMVIRDLKVFTLFELAAYSSLKEYSIRDYLKLLTERGYLECVTTSDNKTPYTYKLVKDNGQYRPDLFFKKPGGRQRIWMSLKPLKRFTYKDVSLVANVSDSEAKRYLCSLKRAGYIKVISESKPGGAYKPALYRFDGRKDAGPRAPQIQKGGVVFDPNINQMVWSPKEGVK